MTESCKMMRGRNRTRSTRRKTMNGGSGLIDAAKSLLLPALLFIGQKFQQNRVITRRKRDMKKTLRRRR